MKQDYIGVGDREIGELSKLIYQVCDEADLSNKLYPESVLFSINGINLRFFNTTFKTDCFQREKFYISNKESEIDFKLSNCKQFYVKTFDTPGYVSLVFFLKNGGSVVITFEDDDFYTIILNMLKELNEG
jgi:hypothetical protein